MARSTHLPLIAFLALAVPYCCAQQTESDSVPLPPHAKPVPERPAPAPFPIDSSSLAKGLTIEVRTPDQMTEQDRLREADAESSIAERAGFEDLEFNAGKWSYRQLVCPDFPNHLFLRFTRDNGRGDQSMFSASIPLNGEGHVRIIPILRRSYSLFSPAPINEITIAAFNRIRNEEKPEGPPSWAATALCYAALAGANPVAVPYGDASGVDGLPRGSASSLVVERNGSEVVRLADASARPKPVVWTMMFSKKGRLMKVKRLNDEVIAPKPVPAASPLHENPVPQAAGGQ